jgi:exodeoxyribonuclease V alpha subunit
MADAIAMKLGVEKTAMIRVRAGISYALTEAMDEGHCGLPTAELTPLAEKLLDVPQDLIRTALDLELADGTVIADCLGETACEDQSARSSHLPNQCRQDRESYQNPPQ